MLLLNATLTVRAEERGSHRHKGWETFTDEVIRVAAKTNPVFILWGEDAQEKEKLIDTSPDKVIKSPHPCEVALAYRYTPLCPMLNLPGCGKSVSRGDPARRQ